MASGFKLSSSSSEIDRLVIGHVQTDSLTSTVQTEEPPVGLSRMIPGESSSPEPQPQLASSSSSSSLSVMTPAAFEPSQTKPIAPVKYSPTNFSSWNDLDDAIDDVSRFIDKINVSSQEPELQSHSSNIRNQLPSLLNSESSSLNIPENDRETDVDGANVQDCLKTAAVTATMSSSTTNVRQQTLANRFECESDDRNSISSNSRQDHRKREKSHRSSRAKSPIEMPMLSSSSHYYRDSECGNRTDDTDGKRSERKYRSSGTTSAKPKEKRRHRSHRSSKNANDNWWNTMADLQQQQQLPTSSRPFPFPSSTIERSRKSSFSESYAPSEYSQHHESEANKRRHLEAQNWNKYYEAMQMNMMMMNPYYNNDYVQYQNWLMQKQQYAHPMANYPPIHPLQSAHASLNYAQQFSNAAAYNYPVMTSANFNPNDYNRNFAQSTDVNDLYASQKSFETKSNSFEYEQDNGLKKFATQHSHVNISCGNLITCNSNYLLMEGSGSGSGAEGCSPVVQVTNIGNKCKNSKQRLELEQFPGPLIESQTHKTTVIEYCEDKIRNSVSRHDLTDIDSYNLIWEFLILVIRQNGSVDGADISDLLMKNEGLSTLRSRSSKDDNKSSSTSSLSDLSKKSLSKPEVMDKYRQYLFRGDLNKALEWAMNNDLWDHALFLSSRMDKRTYAIVLAKFEAYLTISDPIQTLYQFLSQKKPTFVSSFAGDKINEWRKHLAIMIANMVHEPEIVRESIINMGDVLFAKNKLYAAQFCYLVAKAEFGKYGQEGVKLVLLGSSQSSSSMVEFATNEAIMMTEIYEYICQMDASQSRNMSSFLPYKYTLAMRMVDCGLTEKAMLYLEQIAKQIRKTFEQNGSLLSRKLVQAVHDLGEKLQYQVTLIEDVDGLNWIQKLAGLLNSREQQTKKSEKKSGYLEPISEIPTASELETESNKSSEPTLPMPPQQLFQPQNQFRTQTPPQVRLQQRLPPANFQTHVIQQPLPSAQFNEEQRQIPQPQRQQPQPQQLQFNSQSSMFQPMQYSTEPMKPQQQQQQPEENPNVTNSAPSDLNLPFTNFSKSNITLPNQNVNMGGDEKPKQNYFDEQSLTDGPLPKATSSQSSPSATGSSTSGAAASSGDSKLGWAFSALTKLLPKTPKQVHLPDDSVKNIVFDKKTERWINKAENSCESNGVMNQTPPLPPPPPPKSASFTNLAHVPNANSPMTSRPPNPPSQPSDALPGLFSSTSYDSLLSNSLPANINNSKNTIQMISPGTTTNPVPSSLMPPINNVNSFSKPQSAGANTYRLQNNRGAKKMYVNVLSQQKPVEGNLSSPTASMSAPAPLQPHLPVSPNNYFNQMTGTNPVSPIANPQTDATLMASFRRDDNMNGLSAPAPPVQLFTPPMNAHSSFSSPFSTSAIPNTIDPANFNAKP